MKSDGACDHMAVAQVKLYIYSTNVLPFLMIKANRCHIALESICSFNMTFEWVSVCVCVCAHVFV